MSRAYGSDAQLLLKKETTYGTQATGNFVQMPFNSSGLDSEQNLVTDPVLGQGRDPLAPQQDVINVDGPLSVPVDPRYLGYWLTGLLGVPTSTDETAHWQHIFESGVASLPSFSCEVGHPQVPAYFVNLGVRVDAMEFDFQRSGVAACNVELIAQGQDAAASTSDGGTPATHTYKPFSQFQGAIKKDGTQLANILSGNIRYSNNLNRVETIRNDGKIEGADPTIASLTGSIDVHFADLVLMNAATSGTPMELEFSYEIDSNTKLVITGHEIYIPKPKNSVDGPNGITASFAFQGALDQAEGKMMTVTLLNDLDDTNY